MLAKNALSIKRCTVRPLSAPWTRTPSICARRVEAARVYKWARWAHNSHIPTRWPLAAAVAAFYGKKKSDLDLAVCTMFRPRLSHCRRLFESRVQSSAVLFPMWRGWFPYLVPVRHHCGCSCRRWRTSEPLWLADVFVVDVLCVWPKFVKIYHNS